MRRRIFLMLLIVSLLVMVGTTVRAEKKPKLVILLFNQVSWEDLIQSRANHLDSMIQHGAAGWMNIKNYSGYLPASAYMTIGMSSRTRMDDKSGNVYGTQEKIQEEPAMTGGDLFHQFTGAKPPKNGVVVPEIARLTAMAVTVEPEAVPGLLGKTLAQNGKRIALFGNADIPGELHREAALMAMTPIGRIPLGSVGQDLLLNDSKAPFGWRTDYAKVFAKMKAVWDKTDVVLIETGDTSRIESAQEMLTPERIGFLRRQAIREADPFIGRVLKELHPDAVMLFGVSPNKQMLKDGNNGLEPILVYGKGRGYLSSASTRRAGYVTNLDLYSTICDLVGVKPEDSGKGFVMNVDSSKTDLNALVQEKVFFKNLRNARYPINDGLTILFLIGVLGGIVGIWQGYSNPTVRRYLTCVIAVLLLPVGVLFGGLAGYDPVWPMIGITLGSSLLGALILTKIFSFRRALVFTLFIVPLLLLTDVFCGGQWMLRSAMGSDLIAGGRFFGMGNDLMGVVIGSLTAGIGLLIQEFPDLKSSARWWGSIILLLSVAGIGLPMFGANVGGMIAAMMATVVAILVLMEMKISLKKLGLIFVGVIVFVVLVACADAFFNPRPTHAGRAILLLLNEGSDGFFWIVSNKLGILGRTVLTSMWSWLCIIELLALGAVKKWVPQFLTGLKERYPQWMKMMTPLGVGCFFAFAVNDTGIIAAALIFSYFWLTACGLYLDLSQATVRKTEMEKEVAL